MNINTRIKKYLKKIFNPKKSFGNLEYIKTLDFLKGDRPRHDEYCCVAEIDQMIRATWECPRCRQLQILEMEKKEMPPFVYKQCINCLKVSRIDLEVNWRDKLKKEKNDN